MDRTGCDGSRRALHPRDGIRSVRRVVYVVARNPQLAAHVDMRCGITNRPAVEAELRGRGRRKPSPILQLLDEKRCPGGEIAVEQTLAFRLIQAVDGI